MEAANKQSFECSYCHDIMSSRQTLLRHKRRKHPEELKGENYKPRKPHVCRNCEFRCVSIKHLIDHYQSHGRKFRVRHTGFSDEEEFLEWKNEIEIQSKSLFVLHRGRRETQTTYVKIFYCNRSGFFVPGGKGKRIRLNMSLKVNYTCSAFIRLEIHKYSGAHEVEFCLDHTHEIANISQGRLDQVKPSKKLKPRVNKSVKKGNRVNLDSLHASSVMSPKEGIKISEIRVSNISNEMNNDSHKFKEIRKCNILSRGMSNSTHSKDTPLHMELGGDQPFNENSDGSQSISRVNDLDCPECHNKKSESCGVCRVKEVVENDCIQQLKMDTAMPLKIEACDDATVVEGYEGEGPGLDVVKLDLLKMINDLANFVSSSSSPETLSDMKKHILTAHSIGKESCPPGTNPNYQLISCYAPNDLEEWDCLIDIKTEI